MSNTTTNLPESGLPSTQYRGIPKPLMRLRAGFFVFALLWLMTAGKLQALDLTSFSGGLVPGQEMILLDNAEGQLSFEEARLQLRTRSTNRYLSLDKLPSNPRWREVVRTAYFVLSKVLQDEEARKSLETSVARLQKIVEQKALT